VRQPAGADLGRIRSGLRGSQPIRNRGRPGDRHGLHRQHLQRRRTRHRLSHQRRHLQQPQRERLRPDPATAPAGFGANGIAVDPTTNNIYATNDEDTSVTTINGNTCKSSNRTGCDDTRTRALVGDYPGSISVDPAVDTAYVADIEGVSVMPLTP
jgi:DNA-binding beta-propeller fold protein YncE